MSRLANLILVLLESGPLNGTGIARALRAKNPRALAGGDLLIYPELIQLESANEITITWIQTQSIARKEYALAPVSAHPQLNRFPRFQKRNLTQVNPEENHA